MIGKTISHYKILEKLGQGGMGVVYKAEDTRLARIVALKFLPPDLTRDPEARTRFTHEARAAATLTHPNICTIHEIDEVDGEVFIAMEFVEGQSLRDKVDSGPLKLESVLDIAIQVSEALQRAHEKKVVHRDVKSANIMVTGEGQAKVMDFGLAKLGGATKITKAGTTVGTIAYMSPEQTHGDDADHRTDVWSLGVVLYEMLTGRLPFRGDYEEAIVYSIINEEPEPVTALRTGVPMELERIVKKAMSKNPSERYQSLIDVLVDLRALAKREQSTTATFPPVMAAAEKSIAVLPLASLSESKDDEYFSDGITEDIIAQLSKIAGLRVISRQSVMQYKGSVKSLREIARELGVSAILEGSIRRSGSTVRIVSQLIDARMDEHMWAETYDREMKDIFAIQSEVAQRIAAALKTKLSPEVKQRLEREPTDNLEAYDYYLRGREYYFRYRRQDNETAIELFKKALALDPSYALAYSGLGDAFTLRALRFGFSRSWIGSAVEAGEKAISIDPNCAEAYKALAIAQMGGGRIRESLSLLHKAIELNPSYYPAFINSGVASVNIGRYDRALEHYQRALELNPAFAPVHGYLAHVHTTLGDFEQAEGCIRKALELQPDLVDAHCDLIDVYLQQGRLREAASQCERVLSLAPEEIDVLDSCGYARLIMGNHSHARRLYEKAMQISTSEIPGDTGISLATRLAFACRKEGAHERALALLRERLEIDERLLEEGTEWWRIPYDVAAAKAVEGEKAEALLWLRRAVDAGWRHYRLGSIDPIFESIRTEEEFQRILAEVKGMVNEMRKRVNAR